MDHIEIGRKTRPGRTVEAGWKLPFIRPEAGKYVPFIQPEAGWKLPFIRPEAGKYVPFITAVAA